MNRAQRILAFTGLLVVAWLLHTMLCEWRYRVDESSVRGSEILVVDAGTLAVPARTPPGTPTKKPVRNRQSLVSLPKENPRRSPSSLGSSRHSSSSPLTYTLSSAGATSRGSRVADVRSADMT